MRRCVPAFFGVFRRFSRIPHPPEPCNEFQTCPCPPPPFHPPPHFRLDRTPPPPEPCNEFQTCPCPPPRFDAARQLRVDRSRQRPPGAGLSAKADPHDRPVRRRRADGCPGTRVGPADGR